MEKLDPSEVDRELARLQGWSLDDGKLFKTYEFNDFTEAFAFMTRVAEAAEEQDHHPDWCNVYKTVTVHLSTHDAGGLTERDFRLAQAMDAAVSA